MNSPIVSVIVAAYNAEKYLARCLNSVAEQTFKDFEVIIVDDGSTDGSRQIAEEFANSDQRFRVIHQSNAGVSSARNTGLNQATGKWVCFLDADDEFPANTLAIYHELFYHESFDFYIGGYLLLDENGNYRYGVPERVQYRLSRDEAIKLMYKPIHYHYLGYIAGKLFKRSIIEKAGIRFREDIFFNEDRLFSTQYMCHCDLICFFTHPVYYYYENPSSAMSMLFKKFNSKFLTDLDAMILMKDSISTCSPANYENAKEGIASSYWRIQGMLNQFHANSLKRLISLHKKLWNNLTTKEYLDLVVNVFIRKAIHRLTR